MNLTIKSTTSKNAATPITDHPHQGNEDGRENSAVMVLEEFTTKDMLT